MGSLFRSELMSLCQLFIQSEAAYNCVSQLGELGCVQFKDLNASVNAFQRRFVNEVRRCVQMERKLRFIAEEISKENIRISENDDDIAVAPQPREMIALENSFAKNESDLNEVNKVVEELNKTYAELNEFKCVLNKSQLFFSNQLEVLTETSEVTADTYELITVDTQNSVNNLNFVAGAIRTDRLPAFERMLWRTCSGNVFLRQTPIERENQDTEELKSVFIIFYTSHQLKLKIRKICDGFRVRLYSCPDHYSERQHMISKLNSRIKDVETVLSKTNEQKHRLLTESALHINNWLIKVRKMKSIYHTMNLFNFDVTQNCLIAECWCPDSDLFSVRHALSVASQTSGSSMQCFLNRVDTNETPPTFFRTNKFTEGFQSIIDSYGVPDYREVNPTPFTIITFPFLFAIMFGDAGHGLIMFVFALWMVLKECELKAIKTTNDIWLTFFNGRYIILLMAAFSIYTGLLYNDVFSKSVNIFRSAWHTPQYDATIKDLKVYAMNPQYNTTSFPYPFGIDPIWQLSDNKIVFLNSFKKKLSVIIGVAHMIFGIALSACNHRYFRKPLNIYCEFVPQIIFLMALFGYMNGLIIVKWFAFNSQHSANAPSLLINIINMFLMKYTIHGSHQAIHQNTWFSAQKPLQIFLLIIAILCIPWMLLIKPMILRKHERKQRNRHNIENSSSSSTPIIMVADNIVLIDSSLSSSSNDFDFGDIVLHQSIHTIEFCLGCVSHTASYLRLWALSLAHSQLSEVLWSLVMRTGLKSIAANSLANGVIMFAVFSFWAALTVSILLVMEALSAFLHALRLHWVEFQSKFYSGSGYRFEPFSFALLLQLPEKEG